MALQDIFASASYPHLALALLAGIVAQLLYTAIYRLYFHPLAKYPGPFWARLTTWPSFWQTTKFNRHVWLYELHEKYGPVIRYRPDAVLFNTPQGYQEIYGPKGNLKKAESFYRVWPHNVNINNTWNVTDISKHARKRRVLNNAFSDRALRGAEPLVHKNVDRWLELIGGQIPSGKDGWSGGLNMAQQVNYLVYDILGDLCFGESFGMKEPGNNMRRMPEIMTSLPGFMYPIATSPWAAWWVWMKPYGLDWLLTFAIPGDLKKWQAFIARNLANRTKKEQELKKSGVSESEKRKDFFYYLFDAEDPETGRPGYDINELWGECELLTAAGADTTSIVTAAMTFYVSRNVDIQNKVASEIKETFSSYDEITAGPRLHGCKYLRAIIHESLRMAPPVPAELAREVLPGGTSVDGHYFPEGTRLGTCTWCLSYNKDVYPSPFTFRPERWIAETTTSSDDLPSVSVAESGECAFSTGSRGCVGKNMAWMEMMIVLAKLVWKFEMKQDPGNDLGCGREENERGYRERDQYQIRDGWVAQRDGPMVMFKERPKV